MNRRLHLRSWAVNVLLLLAAVYTVLGIFTLINFLHLPYSPLTGELPGDYTIHLILISPSLDQSLLHVLSAVVILSALYVFVVSFPSGGRVGKYALGWMLLSFLLLILRLALYVLGAPALGGILLLLAGFTSLVFMLLGSPHLGVPQRHAISRFLIYSCAIILAVETLSAACLVLYPFNKHLTQNRSLWRFVDLETQLFHIPSTLVTIIFTLTLLSWSIKPFWTGIKSLTNWGTEMRQKMFRLRGWLHCDPQDADRKRRGWKLQYSVIVLSGSVAFAVFYALYPHLLAGNLTAEVSWSSDMIRYAQWVDAIGQHEGFDIISYTFINHTDRPLTLLLMYGAVRFTGSSIWIVLKSMPFLLAPLLSGAVYFFTLQGCGRAHFPSTAALFTIFSFQITVGFGIEYLSNWMGLVLLYVFSGLLLKSLQRRAWLSAALATLITILHLFIHAYSWAMLMGVLAVFTVILGIQWLRRRGSLFDLKVLGTILAVNLSVDVVRNLLLSATVAVAKEGTQQIWRMVSWQNLSQFWASLHFTFHGWIGFYNNPVLIVFTLLGVAVLLYKGTASNLYLLSFLIASSIPFTLGDSQLQIRIIYNLPLQIMALMGLMLIMRIIRKHTEPAECRILSGLLMLLYILVNINYALRCAVLIAERIHPI